MVTPFWTDPVGLSSKKEVPPGSEDPRETTFYKLVLLLVIEEEWRNCHYAEHYKHCIADHKEHVI